MLARVLPALMFMALSAGGAAQAQMQAQMQAQTQTQTQTQTCSSVSPTDAARAFYQKHYGFIYEGAGSPPLSPQLRRLIAANIKQSIDAGEIGAIDWDFWTDAQDGQASHTAKAFLIRKHKSKAVVRLRYSFLLSPDAQPQPEITDVYLLRNASGCWLVDDLVHDTKSLRRLLEQGAKESAQ